VRWSGIPSWRVAGGGMVVCALSLADAVLWDKCTFGRYDHFARVSVSARRLTKSDHSYAHRSRLPPSFNPQNMPHISLPLEITHSSPHRASDAARPAARLLTLIPPTAVPFFVSAHFATCSRFVSVQTLANVE